MFLLQDGAGVSARPAVCHALIGEVRDEEGLCALAGQWQRLHAQTTHPSPSTSWEWAWTWWHHFQTPMRRLRVVTITDAEGDLLAIAPLYSSAAPFLSREVRLLGDDGRDGEGMTDEPMLRGGREAEAARLLLQYLLRGPGHEGWDFLKLRLPHSVPQGLDEIARHFVGPDTPLHHLRHEDGAQVVALPWTSSPTCIIGAHILREASPISVTFLGGGKPLS